MPRIGTTATMPSRHATFSKVLPVLARQLDRVFVFLDGFETIPEFLKAFENVTVIRSQEAGDYHVSGRFLFLQELTEPSVVVSFDDDIQYPPDYVHRLVHMLERFDGKAVVGVFGNIFKPPFTNYLRDRKNIHFIDRLWRLTRVDELGNGTTAFCSDQLSFDIRQWKSFRSDDNYLALEAKKRQLPMWCIPRRKGWLRVFDVPQEYSIWEQTQRDPSEKTALMRQLVAERIAAHEARTFRVGTGKLARFIGMPDHEL